MQCAALLPVSALMIRSAVMANIVYGSDTVSITQISDTLRANNAAGAWSGPPSPGVGALLSEEGVLKSVPRPVSKPNSQTFSLFVVSAPRLDLSAYLSFSLVSC
jgi:hypothetical protein